MHLTLCVGAAVPGHIGATAALVESVGLVLLLGGWCKSGTEAPEIKWRKLDQKGKLRTFELAESGSLTFI